VLLLYNVLEVQHYHMNAVKCCSIPAVLVWCATMATAFSLFPTAAVSLHRHTDINTAAAVAASVLVFTCAAR
jgi:hypothetical protein